MTAVAEPVANTCVNDRCEHERCLGAPLNPGASPGDAVLVREDADLSFEALRFRRRQAEASSEIGELRQLARDRDYRMVEEGDGRFTIGDPEGNVESTWGDGGYWQHLTAHGVGARLQRRLSDTIRHKPEGTLLGYLDAEQFARDWARVMRDRKPGRDQQPDVDHHGLDWMDE